MSESVSTSLSNARRMAKRLLKKGEEALVRKDKIAAFLKQDDATTFFYRSSICFKQCSRWRDAGDVLLKCGDIYKNNKMLNEAAAVYTDAAEAFIKVDKTEALNTYASIITLYCELGRFDIAGKIEKKIAVIHHLNKHYEEASFHYRKAGNLLVGENLLDQSDLCFEASALCLVEIGKPLEAMKDFETVAYGCIASNLKRFNVVNFLFLSVLCLIGEPMVIVPPKPDPSWPLDHVESEKGILEAIQKATDAKYTYISAKIKEYEKVDFLWAVAKEYRFLNNIIRIRRSWDRHDFADHVYFWHNVRPLERTSLIMMKVIYQEFVNEYERREVRKARLDAAQERRIRRKEKWKEMKKFNEEMGIYGPVVVDEDDEDRRLLKIIAGDRSAMKISSLVEEFSDSEQGSAGEEGAEDEPEGEEGEEGDGAAAVDNVQEEEPEEEEEELGFDEEGKERKKRGKKIAGAERSQLRTF